VNELSTRAFSDSCFAFDGSCFAFSGNYFAFSGNYFAFSGDYFAAAADDLCARSSDDNCMLTIAIKMESNGERGTKRYLISSLVCDATLHHRFAAPSEAWVEQVVGVLQIDS